MNLHKQNRDERGAIAVVFGVSALILFVIAGLVVDLGFARDTRRDSQNAADASALAAVAALYPTSNLCSDSTAPPCYTDAIAAAKSYAQSNYDVSDTDWASCTDPASYWAPVGSTPCISFTDNTLASTQPATPTKVRVLMPTRVINTPFGGLAGTSRVPVRAFARAAIKPAGATSCGLCVIGSGTSDLGNGDVTVSGGSVQVNGNVNTGPTGGITATPSGSANISVAGTATGNFSPSAIGPPDAVVIADPLAGLTMFTTSEMTAMPTKTDPCSAGSAGGSGVYGTFQVPNNATCQLQAGTYVITGAWTLGNNSVITGTGVTLYVACGTQAAPRTCNSPGENGGSLDFKNGNVGTDPNAHPTPSTIYPGLIAPTTGRFAGYVVIYDRNNTSPVALQGNGYAAFTGTVYAKQAQLQFPGNSCINVTNGPVIVGSMYANGNQGCVSLTSVNGAPIPLPPGDPALDQ